MKNKFVCLLLSFVMFNLPLHASQVPMTPTEKQAQAVNLNRADVKVLSKSIKGIGKKRAEAIVKYRGEHGDFKRVEDLASVPGIGKTFVNSHLQELKNKLIVE
ncbi:competence protein ComEA [Legionella birminghamensis]|uniref:Competence protein ComEA n=1 Tax=Legionella birminghamensis TaxID=28083 RepID=A0A378IBK1_9GAMM|nr:helix-hairpin-helix domain-containing protein [Legionella birminghamensis]KTC76090.1 competence protein ComEA [Legionella birminghamensis]STX32286.1 competence protein ComEA [Legionella birminghamensis]